jgi:hypothetical protein
MRILAVAWRPGAARARRRVVRRRAQQTMLLPLLLSIRAANADAPPSAIRVGEPSLVGSGRYTAWTLAALPNPQRGGAMDLLVDAAAHVGDEIMRSSDGGVSWRSAAVELNGYSVPPLGLTTALAVDGGSRIHGFGTTTADYQQVKTPFSDFHGHSPAFFEIGADGQLSALVNRTANVSGIGLPDPMGCIQTTCCNCPFRFDSGNTVRMADGSLVISINVFLAPAKGEKGDGSSVAIYSSDAEGLAWRFRSYVGRADELQWSGEGPNESTLVLLSDGKTLLCIMRMDAGDGHSPGKPCKSSLSLFSLEILGIDY